MSRIIGITFRGAEQEVEVTRDSGYEPDTGAHEIEWHFVGMDAAAYNALNVTAEEEEAFVTQIYEALAEDHESGPEDWE